MTTKDAATTLITGLLHVGGTSGDVEKANALWADGDYEGVRKVYEDLEEEMWRETRRDKDRMRGYNDVG